MSAVAERIEEIKKSSGVKSREVAQLLNTTPETVSRWSTGKTEPRRERLQTLLTLGWLVEQLAEFYEPDQARLWLFTPHRLLDGERPADRIQRGRIQDVLAIIDQLRDGAYA